MSPFILLLLQATSASFGSVPIAFTQDSDTWPVVLSASGTVALTSSSVKIDLSDIRVADQPTNPNSIPYTSYRVCLAYKPSVESWQKSTCSNWVNARFAVKDGESVTLPPRKIEISTKDHPPVTDFWLVLELKSVPTRGKTWSVYSHTQRTVFKGLASK